MVKKQKEEKPLRLDLGAGMRPKEGFIGVDILPFKESVIRCDLRKAPWPWKDGSVDEVHCSHFL